MKKNVIITGANSGIGKAATLQFAKNGHRVIMACRDLVNGQEVQREIITESGNDSIDLIKIDLASFQSIHSFCDTFRSKYDKLDILIHNAGCFNHGVKEYQKSEDNIELTFAINVFAPFLMTMLLKDLLIKSDNPKILGASSNNITHFFNTERVINFENILEEKDTKIPYNSYQMYGDSKMAFSMINQRMSEVFKKDGVKVNSLMITGTKMSKRTLKKFSPGFRILGGIQNLFLPPTTYMANNYFEICTSNKFNDVTGKLISHKGNVLEVAPKSISFINSMKEIYLTTSYYPCYADDKVIQDKLWKLCEDVCLISTSKS